MTDPETLPKKPSPAAIPGRRIGVAARGFEPTWRVSRGMRLKGLIIFR
jgi:hypothetical protein